MNHYHVIKKVVYTSSDNNTAGADTSHYLVEAASEGDAVQAIKSVIPTQENSPDAQFTVKRAMMIENRDSKLAPIAKIYML